MIATLKRTLAGTAAAVCFAASFATNAGGVFYQSDFDPLGFAGSAQWRVDDNCNIKSLATGYYGVNLLSPGGCDVALWSLTVSLWTGGSTTLPTIASDPSLITVPFENEASSNDPTLVAGIYVINATGTNGALAGVDTFLIGPELINNGLSGSAKIAGKFGVQFTSGHSPLGALDLLFGGSVPAITNLVTQGAYLWEEKRTPLLTYLGLCPEELWASFACSKESTVVQNSGPNGGYARFTNLNADGTFQQIPEPGSLALLGGALVAGWFSRRRKAA